MLNEHGKEKTLSILDDEYEEDLMNAGFEDLLQAGLAPGFPDPPVY